MSIPWSSPMWYGKITVAFSYPQYGWVLLALLAQAFNQYVIIHCSDVFQPFPELFEWLNKLADNQFPAEFTVDEEGQSITFIAVDGGIEKGSIELILQRTGETEPIFRCRTDKLQLINEFIKRFEQWLEQDYDIMEFGYRGEEDLEDGYGFDLRLIDISELKNKIGHT